MTTRVGARLGPYEIVSPLGAGGMGEVYKARDTRLGRMVAIKVLLGHHAEDPAMRERFEREARAISALSHPSICTLYDLGEHEGTHFLVMEYLEGETLAARLAGGALPQNQALKLGTEIATALSVAHSHGIIHRDLKPGNVMLTKTGVKLLDFGLAKLHAASHGLTDPATQETASGPLTERGAIVGTLQYMAPEQLQGKEADARSDIFAFGCLLYEMISGRRAFVGETQASVIGAILHEEPTPLGSLQPMIPAAVDQIVRHCMEKDREDRFQTAKDIVFALSQATAQTLTNGSRQVTRPQSSTPWSGRQRWLVAGVIALLGVGLTVMLTGHRAAIAPAQTADIVPSIAVLPFRNLSDDKSQEYFSDGLSEELSGLLAKVKELHVAGHASSSAFKGKTEDLASIGQKLHVATVLEGSVRRSGGKLRISTQLVNVADGYQMWSETYDRQMADVFTVQDEIAEAVVAALKVKLLPHERPATSQHRTSNTEAYNQFLLGQQFFNRQNVEGYRRSAVAFDKAVTLDAEYAAAYAGLARVLTQLVEFTDSVAEQVADQKKALWAAERAVALDPDLAEACSARANVRTYIERDWVGAESDFERAFSLNPGDALAYAHYARLLARLGRLPEAIAAVRKATEIDPLVALSWTILGAYLYSNGQFTEARMALTRALEISPENEHARFFLGITALLEGNPKEALSGPSPTNNALRKTLQALAEYDLGHERESQQALDELIGKHGQTTAYRVAQVYARRGDRERAFEWLDHAYTQRDSQLATLKIDPLVATLRSDPRYLSILKKLNLPMPR